MSDLRKTISKFVWTRGEWQWSEAEQRYVLLDKAGYFYDGPWSLAHDVSPIWAAEDYQWFADDAGIGSATALAAENTAISPNPGTQARLRVNVGETNGAAGTGEHTGGWTLQYSINGGTWTTLGAATAVRYFDSSNLTDGTVIALANYALNWSGGGVQRDWGDECEDGVSSGHSGNIWSNDYCEIEYTVDFNSVSDTDTVTFRMLAPDGTSAVTFTNVPTANITAGATINNVTSPGSDNYAAATDNVLVRRERSRQRQDSAVVSDPTDKAERKRWREQLDNADLSYSEETLRRRVVEILNNVVSLTDSITATQTAAPKGGTFTDSLDGLVNDYHAELRLRYRELQDTLSVLDAAIALRERNRLNTESLSVTDSQALFSERVRSSLDSITATDDAIELRQRFRVLLDSIEVTDLALIPEIKTILQDAIDVLDNDIQLRERYRVLSDSIEVTDLALIPEIGTLLIDTVSVSDDAIQLRQRFRVLADAISVEDFKNAQYVPPGAVTYTRTLTDNKITVVDASIELRERVRNILSAVTVTDNHIELRDRVRQAVDAIAVTDDKIATVIGGDINFITLSDAAVLLDSLVSLRQRTRLLFSAIAVGDVLAVDRERNREATDAAALTDSVAGHTTRGRLAADLLSLDDAFSLYSERARVVTDNPVVTDSILVSIVREGITIFERILSDQISLSDAKYAQTINQLVSFIVKHGVESLSVDHGVERRNILHKVRQKT